MTTETESHERAMRIHDLLQGPVLELVQLLEQQAGEWKKDRGSLLRPKRTPLAGSETGATEEQYAGVMERQVRMSAEALRDAYDLYYCADDTALSECGVET